MKKKHYMILILCIGILLLYYLSEKLELSVVTNLTLENVFYLLTLTGISLCTYVLSLRILLRSMGYKKPLKPLYLILTSSLATNYVNPIKIGFPLRIYLYKKVLNIPLSVGTASLGIEIFNQVLLLSIISIVGIADIFSNYSIRIPLLALSFLILMIFAITFLEPEKLKKHTNGFPFKDRINRLLDIGIKFQEGIKKSEKKALVIFTFLLFLMYVISAIRVFVILMIFGVEANIVHLTYVQFISGFIATVSMVPMGLGVRDASITLLLMQLGVPNEVAISAALIERTMTTGLNFILGTISASALGIKFLDFKKQQQV